MKHIRMRVAKCRVPIVLTSLGLLVSCGDSARDSAAAGVGASNVTATAVSTQLTCDESLKKAFVPDGHTKVVLVKAFKKGDPITLGAATTTTSKAANDLCVVKLVVGPGNPGLDSLPSTSPGIGIEVWLPSVTNWNKRIHNLGGGGWGGGTHADPTVITNASATGLAPSDIAGIEGAVSATTDTGHADAKQGGSFAMRPDGTINTTLWNDFARRSLHETAVKSKALATAYYGSAPLFSYWEGISTGGRQGLVEAQNYPEDYDGILAGMPAINWSRFITAGLYPQLVYQQDLKGVGLSPEQLDLVSNAAIAACDVIAGKHIGYIPDPASCTYDPTGDKSVLCTTSGGTNVTAACVSSEQALAINKIWYGMTSDGSVPLPTVDNGWVQAASPTLTTGVQRWFGITRGTSLYGAFFDQLGLNALANPKGPFLISADQVALELQNPTIAEPSFTNLTGNGASGWRGLSYSQLSNAYDRGVALQSQFGNIDTNVPDLSAFKEKGGKLLHWHGLSDEVIMPQGSVNYYSRVLAQMGGLENVQSFYRLFLIPGMGHGTPNGNSNANATPPVPGPQQLYSVLTDWVEKGMSPSSIILNTPASVTNVRSQPICAFPAKATYKGSGDPYFATSYTCL